MRRVLAAAVGLLGAAACLDPPVTESVEIRFGASEIEVISLGVALDLLGTDLADV